MSARLLRLLNLYTGAGTEAENRTIRIREDTISPPATGADVDVTLTASALGTGYYLSGDDEASDFFAELESALTAALIIGTSVSVDVNGVDVTDTTRAEGRIKVDYDSGAGGSNIILVLQLSDANTTLPEGVLGRHHTTDWSVVGGTPQWSPGVHRYGWYPQLPANSYPQTRHTRGELATQRGSVTVDAQTWGMFERLVAFWDRGLLSPWVYREKVQDSAWATLVGLTNPTPDYHWGAWEAFCEDVLTALQAGNGEEVWRFYADLAAVHLGGAYTFPGEAPAWTDPAAHGEIIELAGEEWGSFTIEGRRDL